MSPTTVMEKGPSTTTAQRYVALEVNGEIAQTCAGMVMEFVTEDRTIKVEVGPTPSVERPPTGFARAQGDYDDVYTIVPAAKLWIDGKESHKAIAVGYLDWSHQLILLFPATVTLKNKWSQRVIDSPVLYRSCDPDTGQKCKTMHVSEVKVTIA